MQVRRVKLECLFKSADACVLLELVKDRLQELEPLPFGQLTSIVSLGYADLSHRHFHILLLLLTIFLLLLSLSKDIRSTYGRHCIICRNNCRSRYCLVCKVVTLFRFDVFAEYGSSRCVVIWRIVWVGGPVVLVFRLRPFLAVIRHCLSNRHDFIAILIFICETFQCRCLSWVLITCLLVEDFSAICLNNLHTRGSCRLFFTF